jgi:hypothetical protein
MSGTVIVQVGPIFQGHVCQAIGERVRDGQRQIKVTRHNNGVTLTGWVKAQHVIPTNRKIPKIVLGFSNGRMTQMR